MSLLMVMLMIRVGGDDVGDPVDDALNGDGGGEGDGGW